MWIPTRRQLFTSWVLHLQYTSMSTTTAEQQYIMSPQENRGVSKTHSLFVADLKVYQESHEILRDVNEVILQASHDTGACYDVSKCAEILLERG